MHPNGIARPLSGRAPRSEHAGREAWPQRRAWLSCQAFWLPSPSPRTPTPWAAPTYSLRTPPSRSLHRQGEQKGRSRSQEGLRSRPHGGRPGPSRPAAQGDLADSRKSVAVHPRAGHRQGSTRLATGDHHSSRHRQDSRIHPRRGPGPKGSRKGRRPGSTPQTYKPRNRGQGPTRHQLLRLRLRLRRRLGRTSPHRAPAGLRLEQPLRR